MMGAHARENSRRKTRRMSSISNFQITPLITLWLDPAATYLGTNLVSTLSGLDMNDFSHLVDL